MEVTQMVTNRIQHSDKKPVKQGAGEIAPEPNKIGASTPFDFSGKNLTPYGGLLPVATMLEKLGFQALMEETVAWIPCELLVSGDTHSTKFPCADQPEPGLEIDFRSSLGSCSKHRLVRAQGRPTPQFVEEVQKEYDSVVRPLRSFGCRERDNPLAVGHRIIASRSTEPCKV